MSLFGLGKRATFIVVVSWMAACGGATPLEPAGFPPTTGEGLTSGTAGELGGNTGGQGGSAGHTAGAGGQDGPGSGPAACGATLPADIRARFIAFDSDRADFHRQLYQVRADGSGLTRLLTDSSSDKEPSFSPDGMKLAFTSDRAGTLQIFLLDLPTRHVTQLTTRPEGADEPSFSRDGALVTFHSDASVYVVGVDGAGERLVATGLDTFNAYFWPQFSLDGTELVFDRNNEIDAAKIGASGTRMIVQNTTTTIKQPAVSPSGSDVAYQAQCFFTGGSVPSIWTTSFTTNTEVCGGRRVTPADDTLRSLRPAWGTNTFLAYERVDGSTNIGSIAVISRELGSRPCVIVAGAADNRNPSWAP